MIQPIVYSTSWWLRRIACSWCLRPSSPIPAGAILIGFLGVSSTLAGALAPVEAQARALGTMPRQGAQRECPQEWAWVYNWNGQKELLNCIAWSNNCSFIPRDGHCFWLGILAIREYKKDYMYMPRKITTTGVVGTSTCQYNLPRKSRNA